MPAAEALLNELSSIQTFRFQSIANGWNLAASTSGSTSSGSGSGSNKSNKKNKNNSSSQKKESLQCCLLNNEEETNNNVKDLDQIKNVLNNIVEVRKNINSTLGAKRNEDLDRIQKLETKVDKLESAIEDLTKQLMNLTKTLGTAAAATGNVKKVETAPKPVKKPANKDAKDDDDDDDDVDLFGSDDDDEQTNNESRQKLLEAYSAKKAKKPAAVAKSSIVLDVKPWDDETDMKEMERLVRTIEMDGLVWGASKLVPLAFGIKKLQIVCVIEDEKVSVEELSEKIEEFQDFVQSVDIAAFNKI